MGEKGEGKVVNLFTRQIVSQPAGSDSATPPPETAPLNLEVPADDFEFFTKNRTRLSEIAARADKIEKVIATLQGYARSERNIGIRAEGLRGASLADLCESLLSSNAGMWTQKPSYYLAVIGEFSKRIDSFRRHSGRRGSNADEAFVGDTLFVLSNSERVIGANKRADVVTDSIFEIPGFEPDQNAMSVHRLELSGSTLSQLCDIIHDSSKLDWHKRPNFYGAVIMELNEHTKGVQAVLLRDEVPE